MKTIILDDDTFEVLRSALDHSVPATEEPKPAPTPAPNKESIIFVPWQIRTGTFSTTIDPAEVVTFEFNPRNTNGKLASFTISPSDKDAYLFSEMCLSSVPGKFEEHGVMGLGGRLWFSCGGYPKDRYQRDDTRYPNLEAGFNWFVNVRLKDPTATAKINYALMPA